MAQISFSSSSSSWDSFWFTSESRHFWGSAPHLHALSQKPILEHLQCEPHLVLSQLQKESDASPCGIAETRSGFSSWSSILQPISVAWGKSIQGLWLWIQISDWNMHLFKWSRNEISVGGKRCKSSNLEYKCARRSFRLLKLVALLPYTVTTSCLQTLTKPSLCTDDGFSARARTSSPKDPNKVLKTSQLEKSGPFQFHTESLWCHIHSSCGQAARRCKMLLLVFVLPYE